jgi:hypothetical protein
MDLSKLPLKVFFNLTFEGILSLRHIFIFEFFQYKYDPFLEQGFSPLRRALFKLFSAKPIFAIMALKKCEMPFPKYFHIYFANSEMDDS